MCEPHSLNVERCRRESPDEDGECSRHVMGPLQLNKCFVATVTNRDGAPVT